MNKEQLRDLIGQTLMDNYDKKNITEISGLLLKLAPLATILDKLEQTKDSKGEWHPEKIVVLDDDQIFPPIPRKDIAHIIMERDAQIYNSNFRKVKQSNQVTER